MTGGSELKWWLLQRASALYVLVAGATIAVAWGLEGEGGFQAWQGLVAEPVTNAALLLLFLSLLVHAGIGVRNVILDHVHSLGPRLLLLFLSSAWLLACGAWVTRVLIRAGG